MSKFDVVVGNLSNFPLSKGHQDVVYKVLSKNDDSKLGRQITNEAYKYSLLMNVQMNESSRGVRILKKLDNNCRLYLEKDNTLENN